MKKYLLLFLLIIQFHLAQGQQTLDQKLTAWNRYCDKLKGIPEGKEDYPALIKAARAGLKMTPPDKLIFKSLFAFHLAGGFESTYKMDSAIHYYEVSENYAREAKSNSRIVFALRRLAGLYDSKGRSEKGAAAREKLIAIAATDKDEEIQVGANIVLGEYYFNAGLFEKALERYLNYIKYLKLDYERTKNAASRANIGVGYLAIGELYQKLNRPEKSLSYFKESILYLDTYREGLETAYKDLVTSYLTLNRIGPAMVQYQLLKSSVLQSGDYTILIDAQVELGNFYMKTGQLSASEKILNEASNNVKISKEREDQYLVNIALGDLALKQKKVGQALEHYKLALPLALYFKDKAIIAKLYYNKSRVEQMLNKPEEAYISISKYALYQDSLKNESISRNLTEMEGKFQNEVKQQKIELLAKENNLTNIELRQERRTKWVLGGAIFLSLIIVLMIWRNNRNKRRANQLLDLKNKELDTINAQLTTANQTKAKLFSIISHDLRSPVSQLFTFLRLQGKPDVITEEELLKHQQQLISASTTLLESMEDLLLWSKSQMENFEIEIEYIDVDDLFNELIALMQAQAADKNLRILKDIQDCRSFKSDYNVIRAILRNLLQNAVNNSNADSTISLSCNCTNNSFSISVINYAPSVSSENIQKLMDTTQVKSTSSGYGMVIIKEMATRVNAKLNLASEAGGKFTATLFFQ